MAKVTVPDQHGNMTEVELNPRGSVRPSSQAAAEFIVVVLSEIPMNFEQQIAVLRRAKDIVERRANRMGEGPWLANGDWEIAARMVAGICRFYMSLEECEANMDEVFREAQRIKSELDAIGSTADYFEWLEVAARVRGVRKEKE